MAKARILAVDDQRYFREMIAGMLTEAGFDVLTASSGEEALRRLDRTDFDLVLTDLVMPGMEGTELVRRIHERNPDQDVLVVTGVLDVATAVGAMKLGARDYLLKPFDTTTLETAVTTILDNRQLETEHAQLLAENMEYLGERSLYARALKLLTTLEPESLASQITEGLCQETRAQSARLWLAREDDGALVPEAAHGRAPSHDPVGALAPAALPAPLAAGERTAVVPGPVPALWGALRHDGELLGVVRLTDKREGDPFDALDRGCVGSFLQFAEVALANAGGVGAIEGQGLREPTTGAYHFDFFREVAAHEIEKANRFGRRVAIMSLEFAPGAPPSAQGSATEQLEPARPEAPPAPSAVADRLRGLLRAIDVLAVDASWRFWLLLPEADAIGAAVLKRRALAALGQGEWRAGTPVAGFAVFPGDGSRVDDLLERVRERLDAGRQTQAEAMGLHELSLASGLRTLVRQGTPQPPEAAGQLARFLMAELGRRPRERGLLYTAPGKALDTGVREGLESLRGMALRTDLAVLTGGDRMEIASPAVHWVSLPDTDALPPCLLHYGDGPAYALICEDVAAGQPTRLFHTSDRELVEQLAFRLQEEFGLPTVPTFEEGVR